MCVGRYAAKVMRNERSEMEHNRSEMPANGTQHICIPAGCDFAIKRQFDVVHSAGMHHTDILIAGICPNKFERAKGSKRFHFASLNFIFSAYPPTHIKFLTEFHRIFFGTTCISFPIFIACRIHQIEQTTLYRFSVVFLFHIITLWLSLNSFSKCWPPLAVWHIPKGD